jgi:ABC-2 type transport system ATP-binding protein
VTTQYVGEARDCDTIGVMREGRLLYVDTPDGLRRRALGGRELRLAVGPQQLFQAAQALQRHPASRAVRPAPGEPGGLAVVVDDGAEALPALLAALRDADVDVRQAGEHQPSFDEVFVALMEQADAAAAADAGAADG